MNAKQQQARPASQGNAASGHLELLYPSKYVKAADLRGKDVTVIISHLTWENLVMAGGKRDRKVAIHLRSVSGKPLEKAWIVGAKTVLRSIASLTGETDVAKWAGARLTLYPTTCRGQEGKTVECIRVRPRTGQGTDDPTAEMMAPPEPETKAFLDDAESHPDGWKEPEPQ